MYFKQPLSSNNNSRGSSPYRSPVESLTQRGVISKFKNNLK